MTFFVYYFCYYHVIWSSAFLQITGSLAISKTCRSGYSFLLVDFRNWDPSYRWAVIDFQATGTENKRGEEAQNREMRGYSNNQPATHMKLIWNCWDTGIDQVFVIKFRHAETKKNILVLCVLDFNLDTFLSTLWFERSTLKQTPCVFS